MALKPIILLSLTFLFLFPLICNGATNPLPHIPKSEIAFKAPTLYQPPRDGFNYDSPTFRWEPIKEGIRNSQRFVVKEYVLLIDTEAGTRIQKSYTSQEAKCTNDLTICEITTKIKLAKSPGNWTVRAKGHKEGDENTKGTSDWAPPMSFEGGNNFSRCVKRDDDLTGDFPLTQNFLWLPGEWSVGTAVSTQVVRYDLAKKKAAFNTGVGAGAAFRFYRNIPIGTHESAKSAGILKDNASGKNEGWVKESMASFEPLRSVYEKNPKLKNQFDSAAQAATFTDFSEVLENPVNLEKARKIMNSLLQNSDTKQALDDIRPTFVRVVNDVLTSDYAIWNDKAEIWELPVSRIKQTCRSSTFAFKTPETIASPFLSITPTLYASQLEGNSLAVQPAILVGFFEDIINVGAGFNLSGEDQGDAFLLFSIGGGFQF